MRESMTQVSRTAHVLMQGPGRQTPRCDRPANGRHGGIEGRSLRLHPRAFQLRKLVWVGSEGGARRPSPCARSNREGWPWWVKGGARRLHHCAIKRRTFAWRGSGSMPGSVTRLGMQRGAQRPLAKMRGYYPRTSCSPQPSVKSR